MEEDGDLTPLASNELPEDAVNSSPEIFSTPIQLPNRNFSSYSTSGNDRPFFADVTLGDGFSASTPEADTSMEGRHPCRSMEMIIPPPLIIDSPHAISTPPLPGDEASGEIWSGAGAVEEIMLPPLVGNKRNANCRNAIYAVALISCAVSVMIESIKVWGRAVKMYHSFTLAYWKTVFVLTLIGVWLGFFLYKSSATPSSDARRSRSASILSRSPHISLLSSLFICATFILCIRLDRPHKTFGSWDKFLTGLLIFLRIASDIRAVLVARNNSGTDGGRVFFRAVGEMAFDILQRTYPTSVIGRGMAMVLLIQSFWILLWMQFLVYSDRSKNLLGIIAVALGGTWVSRTISRVLGFVAAGGVVHWYASLEVDDEDFLTSKRVTDDRPHDSNSLEGYETVVASDPMENKISVTKDHGIRSAPTVPNDQSHLFSILTRHSLTLSLGSIAKCALTGDAAQFFWSIQRRLDLSDDRRHGGPSSRAGQFRSNMVRIGGRLRSMSIGGTNSAERIERMGSQSVRMMRWFVRNHSDLALGHVAGYYKSYSRAARDVMDLVYISGVEQIIHDDITSIMCTSACAVFANFTVMLSLLFQGDSNCVDKGYCPLWEQFIIPYFLAYTIMLTILEPFRASVKALYVCFAQQPQPLAKPFPIIHHRLCRLSQPDFV